MTNEEVITQFAAYMIHSLKLNARAIKIGSDMFDAMACTIECLTYKYIGFNTTTQNLMEKALENRVPPLGEI